MKHLFACTARVVRGSVFGWLSAKKVGTIQGWNRLAELNLIQFVAKNRKKDYHSVRESDRRVEPDIKRQDCCLDRRGLRSPLNLKKRVHQKLAGGEVKST